MNRGILVFATFVFILTSFAYAQAPDTLWTRTYGQPDRIAECWGAVATPDGGLITAGTITDPGYLSRLYLVKINPDGDTLWTATYSERTAGRAICASQDGGFLAAAYYVTSEVYPYLVKVDSLGNEIWSNIYESWGAAILRSCKPVGEDGYILAGFTYTENALLVRIDSTGDVMWYRYFGGSDADKAWSAIPTSDGGFVMAGWTESFGNGGSDFYIVKTDLNGDSVWTRTYGDWRNQEAREIMEISDGGYVLSGRSVMGDSYLYCLMKINSQGDSLWTFADTAFSAPGILHSFTQNEYGQYVAVGYTYDTIDLYKITGHGALAWSRSFVDDTVITHYAHAIVPSGDGGFYACGYDYNKIWVVKLAPDLTGINDGISALPEKISLRQNFPNPFNASTSISFELAQPSDITLTVYDILGRRISVLADGYFEAGAHSVTFDGGKLSSGVYFYNLKAGDLSRTRSMILLK